MIEGGVSGAAIGLLRGKRRNQQIDGSEVHNQEEILSLLLLNRATRCGKMGMMTQPKGA